MNPKKSLESKDPVTYSENIVVIKFGGGIYLSKEGNLLFR